MWARGERRGLRFSGRFAKRTNRDMRIILASASPRRRELLKQIGLEFETKVSNVEETAKATQPAALVEELSRQKSEAVLSEMEPCEENVLIIGADTVVALDDKVLGKPADKEEAVKMLKLLAGREHQVYTGVTLLYRLGRKAGFDAVRSENDTRSDAAPSGVLYRTFHEMTKVYFYSMSQEEIETYAATGDPMDKAGAYGIQGPFARFVRGIEGDYNNVVGLPVGRLYQEAKEWLKT